jgi:hypothetical protein
MMGENTQGIDERRHVTPEAMTYAGRLETTSYL